MVYTRLVLGLYLWERVMKREDILMRLAVSPKGLIEMKRKFGREKDFRDIQLIEEWLVAQDK